MAVHGYAWLCKLTQPSPKKNRQDMRWKEWRDEDYSGGKGVLKGMSDGGRNERKEGEASDGMGRV